MQWNSGISAALKKMSSNLPVDFGDYSKALQKRANDLLDHKVANTDMTLRHIVSHFIRVSEEGLSCHNNSVSCCGRSHNDWIIVPFEAAHDGSAEASEGAAILVPLVILS